MRIKKSCSAENGILLYITSVPRLYQVQQYIQVQQLFLHDELLLVGCIRVAPLLLCCVQAVKQRVSRRVHAERYLLPGMGYCMTPIFLTVSCLGAHTIDTCQIESDAAARRMPHPMYTHVLYQSIHSQTRLHGRGTAVQLTSTGMGSVNANVSTASGVQPRREEKVVYLASSGHVWANSKQARLIGKPLPGTGTYYGDCFCRTSTLRRHENDRSDAREDKEGRELLAQPNRLWRSNHANKSRTMAVRSQSQSQRLGRVIYRERPRQYCS